MLPGIQRGLRMMIQGSRDTNRVVGSGRCRTDVRGLRHHSVETIGPETRLQDRATRTNFTSNHSNQHSGHWPLHHSAAGGEHRLACVADLIGSSRYKDDNSTAEATRLTTIGDSGRQNLGPQSGDGERAVQAWSRSSSQRDGLEDTSIERLPTNSEQQAPTSTHARVLMRSREMLRKVSVDTTKNDNLRNRLHHRKFCRIHGAARLNPRGRSAPELLVTGGACRDTMNGLSFRSSVEDLKVPGGGCAGDSGTTVVESNCPFRKFRNPTGVRRYDTSSKSCRPTLSPRAAWKIVCVVNSRCW